MKMRSPLSRLTLAALYAVALVLVGFASSPHGVSAAPGYASPALAAQCHAQIPRGGTPAPSHMYCCEACTLVAAPGLGAAMVSISPYRAEISTRLDLAAQLGADLDGSPADLRSRAPPRAI